mmetsp:Transcript_60656/g.145978  ORF Transcript_60656/g.145978 Transcript_60656/m.145978 type:complete len:226 (-) Transcript_60656:628-1305(-)
MTSCKCMHSRLLCNPPSPSANPLLAAGLGSDRTVETYLSTTFAFCHLSDMSSNRSAARPLRAETAACWISGVGCFKLSSIVSIILATSLLMTPSPPLATHSTTRHADARITSPPLPLYSLAFSIAGTSPTTLAASPSSSATPHSFSPMTTSDTPSALPCLVARSGDKAASSSRCSTPSVNSPGSLPTSRRRVCADSTLICLSQCLTCLSTRCSTRAPRYASNWAM